jgi:hypothetical protein
MFIATSIVHIDVFDEWKNDFLVMYIIIFRSKQNDMSKWMDVINRKMQESKPDWKPNAFNVDDANAKINSLK